MREEALDVGRDWLKLMRNAVLTAAALIGGWLAFNEVQRLHHLSLWIWLSGFLVLSQIVSFVLLYKYRALLGQAIRFVKEAGQGLNGIREQMEAQDERLAHIRAQETENAQRLERLEARLPS